jgi:hypothetical protein
MEADVQPKEPLSQVVFVHDYVQLVFQNACISIYNPISVQIGTASALAKGSPGFCDALVGLIGYSANVEVDRTHLTLHFNSGARVNVPSCDPSSRRAESWMFVEAGGQTVVEPNA